jgi:hypothetical protein
MPIKKIAPYLGTLLLPLLLSACVEFEQQVMTYALVDDELTIFQEYHGIFGEAPEKTEKDKKPKKKTELTDTEKQEIRSVVNGERTFFFGNWITEYNRTDLLEAVARHEHPNKELSASEKQYIRTWLPLSKLLLTNITVNNGDFYYDNQRRLSGYQIVRVKNVRQLIAQANRSISLAILAEKPEPDKNDQGRELMERRKVLANAGHNWITMNGNRISVSFPASQEEFLETKNKAKSYTGNSVPVVEVSYSAGLMTIVIGHTDDQPVVISKRVHGPYTTNAVNFIAAEYGIKERLDIPRLKQAAFE